MQEKMTITREELRQLEAKPKTKTSYVINQLICLLPIAMGGIELYSYWFVPNYGTNQITNVYAGVLIFFLSILVIRFVVGIFNEQVHEKLRYKAALYTAIFFLLFLYDFMTLKTGKLTLPFFTWPDLIFNAMIDDRALLLKCIHNSMIMLFTGYFVGVIVGIISGLLAGCSKRVNYWIDPIMKVLGPIPVTTWLPIVLFFAASLFKGSVFLIALGVWYPVTLSTIAGIRNVKAEFFEVAQTLGGKPWQLIKNVAIPAAMPSILQGMTQGMSVACTALMAAEMLGVDAGLGWYITWQRGWAEYAKVYAAVIIICLIFIIVTKVLETIKKKLLHWQKGVGNNG